MLRLVLVLIILFFVTKTETFINKDQHGYDKVWTSRAAFDTLTLDEVKREYIMNSHKLKPEFSGFGGTIRHRKKWKPSKNSRLTRALKDKRFISRLHNIIGRGSLVLNETSAAPEYRIYEKNGEMKWHRDTILSSPPQYEVVITLYNDSDSQFLWKHEGKKDVNRQDTNTNNITIVRAGGIEHAVSPVSRGKRVIIKAAYDVI